MKLRSALRWIGISIVGIALAIQLVPYGRAHANPAVLSEPAWDSPATRDLARRACYDCHSNEVRWPWYSHVAPVSWLVQRDVDEGRSRLNFSEWNRPQEDAHEASECVREGEMPLDVYVWMHPDAKLASTDRDALARGLAATLGGEPEQPTGKDAPGRGEEDDEGEEARGNGR